MAVGEAFPVHQYEVGEEVVVRLLHGGVFEVSKGSLAVNPLPAWTIAEVVALDFRRGEPRYRLSFSWGRATYVCVVAETTIEGTA